MHAGYDLIAETHHLVHGVLDYKRTFGHNVELLVGDQGTDFENAMFVDLRSRRSVNPVVSRSSQGNLRGNEVIVLPSEVDAHIVVPLPLCRQLSLGNRSNLIWV